MNKKFSGKSFIFYGINYIVGFGFIATISSVIKTGNYSLLIFAITAFIAAGVMLAFARGSQWYGQQSGGSYAYVKNSSHRRWLWYINGWNQFMQAPLFSATTPLFFSTLVSFFVADFKYQLILQICSLLFFIVLTIISALSLNISKKVIFYSALIKWIVLVFIFAVIIYLTITGSRATNIFTTKTGTITPYLIISAILSFIYAFAGVEGLAGLSTEVKTKNFRKILLYLFGIIIFIYLVFYLIFIFVPPLANSTQSNYVAALMEKALGVTGLIIFTLGLLFRQITSTIFSMVYYAKTVVPLAQDGFIPHSLSKVAKNGQHKNATIFVTLITVLSMIFLSIIPSIFKIQDSFATILNAGNLVFFIQYLFAIVSILVISIRNKELKVRWWEKVIYILVSIMIAFVALSTLFPPLVGADYDANVIIIVGSYLALMFMGLIFLGSYQLYLKFRNDFFKYSSTFKFQSQNSKINIKNCEFSIKPLIAQPSNLNNVINSLLNSYPTETILLRRFNHKKFQNDHLDLSMFAQLIQSSTNLRNILIIDSLPDNLNFDAILNLQSNTNIQVILITEY
ncbi:APC family permease [Mycoplasma zalophidermidis]|uniref:APC family permease n=1 Tax=Mycoplasma zalophidermidis TaxID=398174 RepID=A0ABS6DRF7_9MOLU|nr:APC family permease [Mycoplasma zalophidermidis]MBU4693593.1 APC family permease [Mycoplasma zalophidermidis]